MAECFLSIIMPAYNCREQIPDTLKTVTTYLDKQEYSSEVIVVDDGSSDGTCDAVRAFIDEHTAPPRVQICEGDHRGKGYAVRAGMLHAQAKYLLFTDVDLGVPISEVGKMIGSLEAGHDIAIGTREGIGASRENEPYLRHVLGRAFNLLVRAIAGLQFQDTQCGFKGFRREVAHDLFRRVRLYGEDAETLKGRAITGFDVEVLYLAVQAGYRIDEVPVRWRCGSSSRAKLLVDPGRMLADVVKLRWMAARGIYEPTQPPDRRA